MRSNFFGDRKIIIVIAVMLLLFLLPLFLSTYKVHLLTEIYIVALFALSLNLMMGYGGMVSFGHAMFYGLGAYSTAFVIVKFGINSLELSFLVAIVLCALVGFVVGLFCVRTHYIFFAMLTLGFGMVMHSIAIKWYPVTGGSDGIIGIGRPPFLGFINIAPTVNFYYFVLCIFLVCAYILWRIKSSPFGEILRATRENPLRTEFIGIDVRRHQLYAFIIAAVFGGIAGSLYGPYAYQTSPEILHWTHSGEAVFMILLGGAFSYFGPIIGAALFIFLHSIITGYTIYWMLFMGIVLVCIVLFFPGGVAGFVEERLLKKYFKKDKDGLAQKGL